MKKLLIALALGIVLVLALASVASADNGPHGRFNGSTDACASCHRIHSAISPDGMLLVANDIWELCTSCHDGSGAVTNVVDGFYDTSAGDPGKVVPVTAQGGDGHGLYGGGFENAYMLTDYGNTTVQNATTNVGAANINSSTTAWAVENAYDTNQLAPSARPVTSAHNVGQTAPGIGATRTDTVWGAGNINAAGTFANDWVDAAPTATLTLECTSCHTPHGAGGRKGGQPTGVPMPSYRLLVFQPSGSDGFDVAGSVGTTGYWDTDAAWPTGANGTALNAATNANLAGTTIVPSPDGVYVPDVNVKWYTPNFDDSLDTTLYAYRMTNSSWTGLPEMGYSMFAGLGDYGGRYWAYRRPAISSFATTNTAGSGNRFYTCPTGAPGVTDPPQVGVNTSCNASSLPYTNLPAHDVMGFWCSTCHDRYISPGTAARTTDSGDPGYHFRHRSQGLPSGSSPAGSGLYTCVDCHNAHGTAAQITALAGTAGHPYGNTTLANTPVGASWAGGSTLLKADNRAICVRCHASAVNFFNDLTTPNASMVTPY
jgi:predicted CXXCH cytochrome family protein